jgi:adenylate kinase
MEGFVKEPPTTMRLVLVGPPGSGKGTQAELLVARLGVRYIGTGEILRDAIRQQTPTGRQVEPLMRAGLLVPDAVVNDVVAELFRLPGRPESFVMDGYPRTYAQAIAFDALLAQQYLKLDAVIDLTIADEEVVRRISGRRCCSNKDCGALYHATVKLPKVANVCDKCGGPLLIRDDDKEETIRQRLQEFHKNTDALLAHYETRGLRKPVSALDPPETIYANIRKQLPQNGGPR